MSDEQQRLAAALAMLVMEIDEAVKMLGSGEASDADRRQLAGTMRALADDVSPSDVVRGWRPRPWCCMAALTRPSVVDDRPARVRA